MQFNLLHFNKTNDYNHFFKIQEQTNKSTKRPSRIAPQAIHNSQYTIKLAKSFCIFQVRSFFSPDEYLNICLHYLDCHPDEWNSNSHMFMIKLRRIWGSHI